MTSHFRRGALAITLLALWSARASAADGQSQPVEIRDGTATFDAATNLSAIRIHGKSTALEGRARIRQDADEMVIEELEALLPVKTLKTGMALRDDHMRKYVFATPDGLVPDVRFAADRTTCTGSSPIHTCTVSGELFIRNTPRPFVIVLKVTAAGAALHAAGDGLVRLSTYAITPPSQLGVTAKDEVKLHMEFVVTRVAEQLAQGRR